MNRTKLIVRDQCNVKFTGLDPIVRRKIYEALKFMVPNARYTPQYKLGRWDGTVSFCTIGGGTYLNLLDRVLPIVMDAGYDVEIDDRRPECNFNFPQVNEALLADRVWPMGHQLAGEPIILRGYQVDAITAFISNIQSVQTIATAAGKTVVTAALSSLVEPYGRSIVIVPSKSLVTQTEADYRNIGLDVGVYFGDRKEHGHTHTIATWQSLATLAKSGKIMKFIDGVVCVISDECHIAKAKLLKELLTGPFATVPIRWGLTGTVPKEEHESFCLLAAIGPVVNQIRAAELQEKGVLASCQVEIVQLQDNHVEYIDYESEHSFLVTDSVRLQYIANLIKSWSASGNTLVLVDRIETGNVLVELLPDAVFISGKTKVATRQGEYDQFQTTDSKVIVASYGVASTGINLPRIFNLVLLEPGKSFVRCMQSVGRSLRKAGNKTHANIFDVCSSLKFSKRHLSKRKPFYTEAQFPHVTTKVNYL